MVDDFKQVSEHVEISGEVRAVTDDRDDDKLIECALPGGASTIVSRDHHLLELGNRDGISLLSAAEFLAGFP